MEDLEDLEDLEEEWEETEPASLPASLPGMVSVKAMGR